MSTRIEHLKGRIRESGLRSTSPRVAVLGHLEERDSPGSHAEVAEALSALGFDRATIYRNLMDLTQAGLLARISLGENVWRFEVRNAIKMGEGAEHPHFVCVDCGLVSCLEGYSVDLKPSALETGHPSVSSIHEILIRGVCIACEAP